MHTPAYILVLVCALTGLWLFWDQALKRLFLDAFREHIFSQRFALFQLGMEGQLSFDSALYRQIETLLCGLLRSAHDVTFLTFMFSRAQQENAKNEDGYVDISHEIALKMTHLNPNVQLELAKILDNVRRAILLYVAFTSLLFVFGGLVLMTAKGLGIWRPDEASRISDIVEREAYRSEMKRAGTLAHA